MQRRLTFGGWTFRLAKTWAARVWLKAAVALAAGIAGAQQGHEEAQALLGQTNLFAHVPLHFHATVVITRADWLRPLRLEVWRGGRDKLLARVLNAAQAGRFFLEVAGEHYFLAPHTRQPVKIAPGLTAAAPLSFEGLLGVDVEKDFDLARVEWGERIVTFHLVAKPESAAARATPRVRWVVDRTRRVPVRLDIATREERVVRVVEFEQFAKTPPLVPRRLSVKDVLRGGPPLGLAIESFELAQVPEGLFSLSDATARSQLPPVPPQR